MTEPHYIKESKIKCKLAGMDPDKVAKPKKFLCEVAFEEKLTFYREILSVVRFFSNKLLDSLKGTPILVVVSDADGYLIDVTGDETIKVAIEQFGIVAGSQFSQEDTGTNVVTLSLEQKHPVSIIGDQHYHSVLHDVACYGTAFHVKGETKLLGSISIMTPLPFQNPLLLTMLALTVDSIERELLLRKQNKKLDILNQILLTRTKNGIIITDEYGVVTTSNLFAEQILNQKESLLGLPIHQFHLVGHYFKAVLEQEKIITDEEIPFLNAEENTVVCLFDAYPIFENTRLIGAYGQFRDITERYLLEEKYNYLAFHDELTNLPNRRFINKELSAFIEEHKAFRKGNELALLFIDLDRFKIINDNFSHSYGDELLIEVSKRLAGCLGKKDILGRMGGDEFVMLLRDFEDATDIANKADTIIKLFQEPFYVHDEKIYTTASIGIAIYPDHPIPKEKFLIYADNAMYQAKSLGKNRYALHSTDTLTDLMGDSILEMDMRRALEQNEFILYYQPQLHSCTQEIVGLEALIRWQHPTLGHLAPNRFISLAEENGYITKIGEWVIAEVCKQNKKWQDDGLKHIQVHVNLSSQQFNKTNLVQFIEQTLEETGLKSQYLGVEITEYIAMEDESSINVVRKLKEIGIAISIDDFGIGHNSLHYLKHLPIDFIKIDRSFIADMMKDQHNAIIVQTIIDLTHNLGMEVIAEGVETLDQLEFLKDHNCTIVQGFFLYKPLPAKEIRKLLQVE
ncbi:EAL domain-containing protein [Sporosarcina sp. OR05]|uniref:EAL domain-containing protein n=1 Tax=Sporosarcina sp. OR05 TaxID=2969819 RepID=UPI00352AE3C5